MIKIIKLSNINTDKITKLIIKYLRKGKLVVFPTDTVYGLLCDATNSQAVTRLIEFKSRPIGKPVSVFCGTISKASNLVRLKKENINILNQLLPGPYTAILDSKHKTDPRLESEKATLGIRIPQYQIINQLIIKYGKPVTATSANLSGRSNCYSIDALTKQLSTNKLALLDLIIDAGKLPPNKPSTVIDLTQDKIKILRYGDVILGKTYTTNYAKQTRQLGKKLAGINIIKSKKPTIFLLEGEMGVGKTVLVKGIADYFNINNIVSPTFVIYYEYDIKFINKTNQPLSQINKFFHFDLFRIEDRHELDDLPFSHILNSNSCICIEWGERSADIIHTLKSMARIILIRMNYISESKRMITVSLINN